MEIKKVTGPKKAYLDLLLLADEQESMLDKYLERGEMFLLEDNGVKAECVVTKEDDGVYELKNIAVAPAHQRKGYGKRLVQWVFSHYPDCAVLYVGTGDCPSTLSFYHSCGFTDSHRVKNFFTDHYDHLIYEDGIQLTDMVYLKMQSEKGARKASLFSEGLQLLEERFGGGKDNLISLATIAREPGEGGRARPAVRTVDAAYENSVFYTVTYGKSNKMLQIAQNPEVSVAGHQEMFTASGTGENLGWVLEPRHSELRAKLRAAFSAWYDMANDESDPNCCILAVRLSEGVLNLSHGERLYHMDFINKLATTDGSAR